jgi:hypothetical protein
MPTAPRSLGLVRLPSDTREKEEGWPVANYPEYGERLVDWLGETVQHYTLQMYLSEVIKAGFEIILFQEWDISGAAWKSLRESSGFCLLISCRLFSMIRSMKGGTKIGVSYREQA